MSSHQKAECPAATGEMVLTNRGATQRTANRATTIIAKYDSKLLRTFTFWSSITMGYWLRVWGFTSAECRCFSEPGPRVIA
jgi:hypothetical protein